MRLRNIPGANEAVAASPYCIQNAAEHRGQWHAFFENDHPIHIEIGMGKGRFLMDLAALHPEINYIGIERYTSVLLRAVQKMDTLQLPNVHFLCEDAAKLPEIFAPEEVDRIYLNFFIHSFILLVPIYLNLRVYFRSRVFFIFYCKKITLIFNFSDFIEINNML